MGTTPEIGKAMNEGRLEVEPTPQGTLAERMRCGGAGLGGFLTPTGVGTVAEEGKQLIELDGHTYILVPALKVDVAIVRAHAGDTWGNLVYRGTSRNFNVPAAMCADYVIAEVENLYSLGELDPNHVHTPGIFVDAVVRSELLYCAERGPQPLRETGEGDPMADACKQIIAARAAPGAQGRADHQPRHRAADADRQLRARRASTSSSRPRTAPSASAPRPAAGCEDTRPRQRRQPAHHPASPAAATSTRRPRSR